MPRILFVAQETGGVGKSTVTRGLVEATENVPILEIESVHRLIEYPDATGANQPGRVQHFPMRADRAAIEDSGGVAARREFDGVVNAIHAVTMPTVVDIGANSSASLLAILAAEASYLNDAGIEIGVVVVVAAEAGALADAGKLLHGAKDWAAALFVVANAVRGEIDPALLKRVAGDAVVTHLRAFVLEPEARSVLDAGQLKGIPKLDRAKLVKATSAAQAGRIQRDLLGFRAAVMDAVKPAAVWLIGG